MTIKVRELDRILDKFQFVVRHSRDLLAWFVVDGKVIVRTRRSWGSGDLPMQHSIRQQLKLNEGELRKAIDCTLNRDDYIEILRNKGLL